MNFFEKFYGVDIEEKLSKFEINLYKRALKGDITILKYKHISTLSTFFGDSPLHFLALAGKIEVLSHPDCSTDRNASLVTPLHILAWKGKVEVLSHPDCSKVKDDNGMTPLHILAEKGLITAIDLKKLFPWYNPNPIELQELERILEKMPTQSIQFILDV